MSGDQRTERVEQAAIDPEFLAQIPIFGGLPERVLARIIDVSRLVCVSAGTELFREGEPARSMFVVSEGELEICKRGRNGAEFCLAVLRRGDCVGEMSLIDIQPRSATVRAVGAAALCVVDQAEIAKLFRTDLEVYTLLVLNIAREISRRLRSADQVLVDMGVAVQGLWAADDSPTPLG
jgi:CRP-like cAMP-binding protein